MQIFCGCKQPWLWRGCAFGQARLSVHCSTKPKVPISHMLVQMFIQWFSFSNNLLAKTLSYLLVQIVKIFTSDSMLPRSVLFSSHSSPKRTVKPFLRGHLKKSNFLDRLSLMQMLQREYSAILSTLIKLPFVIKILALSIRVEISCCIFTPVYVFVLLCITLCPF